MTVLDEASPRTDTTTEAPRLALRPAGARRGAVDGGWWPRSTDDGELLALAAAATTTFGPIVRIALDAATWAGTPRRIGTGPDVLRIDAFRTWGADMVRLVGAEGRLVDLLVIAPATDPAVAEAALAAAAEPDDRRPLTELLGARPS